jgi:hypothetical protein
MKVILTLRDRDLLRLVANARWLTTAQIHQVYFPARSINACQKRLRRLASSDFIAPVRPSRTEQQLWRIGRKGLTALRTEGAASLRVPKRAPGNLDHFCAINALRLWFLRHFSARENQVRFLAEWELKRGRVLSVIPDALVWLERDNTSLLLSLEVDLGTENPSLFAKVKLRNYRTFRSADGQTDNWYVLALVRGLPRLKALLRQLYCQPQAERFLIVDLKRLLAANTDTPLLVPVSADSSNTKPSLLCLNDLFASPHCLSSPQETASRTTARY